MANILIFFPEKNVSSFFIVMQKLLTFLQQNINVLENALAVTFNVINMLVKLMWLWPTGPRS